MTALRAYREPKLTPAQQAALDQGLLPFMLRYGGRDKVRVSEAAAELRLSRDFICDLVTTGQVEAIEATAKGDRPTYIITARSLILWALAHSNVDAQTWTDTVRDFVALLSRPQCEQLAAFAAARAARLTR